MPSRHRRGGAHRFILDVVDQLDLASLSRAHRDDGHAAYDPKTLLGVLLYAYRIGVCSCRQIERRCTEDLASRVLAANQPPTTSRSPACASATRPRCPASWWPR